MKSIVNKINNFPPRNRQNTFFPLMQAKSVLHQCIMVGVMQTPIGIDWSQKVLDFHLFGKILHLFRGGKLFILGTV